MQTRLVVPAIVAGALALAACGGSDSSSDSDDTAPPVAADLVVKAVDPLAWDQDTYTATAGKITVAVENTSSQPHDLRIVGPDNAELPLDLEIPSKGDVETGTVDLAAGAYTLICTIPGHGNMKATLNVG